MQQCPKEAFGKLFYHASTSFFLLLIFFHFTSIFLSKLFIFFGGNPFCQRNQEGYEFTTFSDEEVEGEDESEPYGAKLVDEKVHDVGVAANIFFDVGNHRDTFVRDSCEPSSDGDQTSWEGSCESGETTGYGTPAATEYSNDEEGEEDGEVVEGRSLAEDTDSCSDSETYGFDPTSRIGTGVTTNRLEAKRGTRVMTSRLEASSNVIRPDVRKTEINLRQEDDFLVFQPSKSEGKKLVQEKDSEIYCDTFTGKKLVQEKDAEIYCDTFTIGSTSKDSSEWQSSINCRDSCTDDPFSSSSRRSCPNWESYTVFQKYEEEMLFLDRISVQKLHETESLRSMEVFPRSLSERIVHKLRTRSQRSSEYRHSSYNELESAYVAQLCLTWEALNWNFKYFQRIRASRREFDPGCPAHVAQQFQQFQVLLQRYVENEPYEYGRRPEIFARMRKLAPKLLQVPQYRDSDDDKREEGQSSRIPSRSFLALMEESIRTFMNFLKQDKKSQCQILADLFKRHRQRGTADATLLFLLKKVNKKKKAKLKEIRRSGKCQLRRRRSLRAEEELEYVMGEIDLKVVSRVLRMGELNGEQLHWCENKMSKVRVCDGKLQRDAAAPLFFPAH